MKFSKKHPLVWLCILCTYFLHAQNQKVQVKIGKNILVGTEPKESQLIEPHVAVHPTNPNHLIATAAVVSTTKKSDLDIEHCVVFVSRDAGKTWKRTDMTGQAGLDAWVAFSEKKVIVTTLGPHPIYNEYKFNHGNHMLAYISKDGGDSWTKNPQSLGGYHDGPRSAVAKDGSIYITSHRNLSGVTSQIYLAKLRFDEEIEKVGYVNPSNLNIAIDGITTYNDGTIAIQYQDFQYPISGPVRNENGWRGRLKTRREWLVTSSDQGRTFSPPKLITENFTDRASDLTVDKSEGKFKDRLYSVGHNINQKAILFTSSDNKGNTWTDTKPIEQGEIDGIRIDPMLAVNKEGIVAVAWIDNRDSSDSKVCYSPYAVFSVDGGKTFTKPQKIADQNSCLDTSKSGKNVTRRFPRGGDYFGLTATSDNRFHIVWADARSGKFQIMTSAITVTSKK